MQKMCDKQKKKCLKNRYPFCDTASQSSLSPKQTKSVKGWRSVPQRNRFFPLGSGCMGVVGVGVTMHNKNKARFITKLCPQFERICQFRSINISILADNINIENLGI